MAYKSKHTGQQIDDAVDKSIQHEAEIRNLQKASVTMNAGITKNTEELTKQAKELNTKAPKVGYAPDLKVDFAKELVGRGVAEPQYIGSIRPTGVISIGDGNATIEKVKGNSVVWNQLADTIAKTVTQNGVTFTVSKDNDGLKVVANGEATADAFLTVYDLPAKRQSKRYLVTGCPSGGSKATYLLSGRYIWTHSANKADFGDGVIVNDNTSLAYMDYICCTVKSGYNAENLAFKPRIYSLTQMFGAGNEPTTIEEFEARRPLGVTDDYNEGEIVSYDAKELKSVGFNAFNGTYAKVIGGQQYHALGTITSIGFTTELGGETNAITLDREGMFTSTETGYVYAVGTDICIHLTHTYTPEHTTEYEEDILTIPNIKAIKDKDGNLLFPYGLLSAGNVHDDITATKAVKRIDKRTFAEGDKEDSMVLTDGKGTLFALAEPIEVDLPEPLNLTYDAWDFGTEELIAEGKTTPLNADIVYQFNAVDRIRENTAKNQALEAELAELNAQLTQLTQVSNDENSNT